MSRFFHAYLAGAIGLRGPIHKLNMSSIIYFFSRCVRGYTLCYFGEFLPRTWQPYIIYTHGCVKSSVIERRQYQLGRMADFPPLVTFSVFELYNHEVPQIKSHTMRHPWRPIIKNGHLWVCTKMLSLHPRDILCHFWNYTCKANQNCLIYFDIETPVDTKTILKWCMKIEKGTSYGWCSYLASRLRVLV